MPECNLCGKVTAVYDAEVEGVVLQVCSECLKYGKKVKTKSHSRKKFHKFRDELPETLLVGNYGKMIIKKRKKLGLERKDFARKINEKESLIKMVEMERIRPSDKLVKKIEDFLEVNLTDDYRPIKFQIKKKKKALTLGDIVDLE